MIKIINIEINVYCFYSTFSSLLKMSKLEVIDVYLYPNENAIEHKTNKFELVHDEDEPIPVLRRGQRFSMAVRFKERNFEEGKDLLRLIFSFGNKLKKHDNIFEFYIFLNCYFRI